LKTGLSISKEDGEMEVLAVTPNRRNDLFAVADPDNDATMPSKIPAGSRFSQMRLRCRYNFSRLSPPFLE
jgi:hypothetical protein